MTERANRYARALTSSVTYRSAAEDSTPRRHHQHASEKMCQRGQKTNQQVRNANSSHRLEHELPHPRTPSIGSTPPRRWRRPRPHNCSLCFATIRTPRSLPGPKPTLSGYPGPLRAATPDHRCRTSRHRPPGDDASLRSLQPTCCHEHPPDAQLPGLRLSPFQLKRLAPAEQTPKTPSQQRGHESVK